MRIAAQLTWISILLAAIPATSADETARPNIMLIMADDLGYADVGFNGATDITTPELDKLAAAGTVFSSAYVAHPFCGPSRAALMTGRYPQLIGAHFNLDEAGAGPEEGVAVDEPLFSEVLQDAGYRTGLIGKWHLGEAAPFHPNNRGFDEFFGFLGGGHTYFPDDYQRKYDAHIKAGKEPWRYLLPLERNGEQAVATEYLTDAFSSEAVEFIRKSDDDDQPFFLFLSYNAPHTPLEAKEEDLKQFANIKDEKRRTYAAMVYSIDRGVGRVIKALEETGQYEDTLIIFLSDNGGRLDAGANNTPLKMGKNSSYEGGYRVPMFFHWPGKLEPNTRFQHPVSALDFYPMFARLAEADIPSGKQLSGKDVWDDVVSNQNPRKGEMVYSMRYGSHRPEVGARRDSWKIFRIGDRPWQLFNLDEDIGEERDVSSAHPDRVREMVRDAGVWSESHIPPQWFGTAQSRKIWAENGMPNYEKTFAVD